MATHPQSPALLKLKSLLAEPRKGDVLWHLAVGECVERECPAAERAYGENRIEKLAKRLRKGEASLGSLTDYLWYARAIANCYSRQELKALDDRARQKGLRLTWSHLKSFAELPDSKARRRVEDLCVSRCLSVHKLAAYIRRERGGVGSGGRRPVTPERFVEGADNLSLMGKRWLAVCRALVTEGDAALVKLARQKLTKIDKSSRDELVKQLAIIEEEAGKAKRRLTRKVAATGAVKKPHRRKATGK